MSRRLVMQTEDQSIPFAIKGTERITFRNPRFSQFSIKDKYGIIRTFKSKIRDEILNGADFKRFEGDKIIAPNRCCLFLSYQYFII